VSLAFTSSSITRLRGARQQWEQGQLFVAPGVSPLSGSPATRHAVLDFYWTGLLEAGERALRALQQLVRPLEEILAPNSVEAHQVCGRALTMGEHLEARARVLSPSARARRRQARAAMRTLCALLPLIR